jgi:ribonuclease HII
MFTPKFTDRRLMVLEDQLYKEGFSRIMGLDEVGRGCLAGPVVAAGVILNPDDVPDGLIDSKQLTASDREYLSREIKARALFYTIQWSSVQEIDQLNILWASLQAMEKCVQTPGAAPDYLFIDGNRYLPTLLPHQCLIKGDSRSASIAAASIIAKVYRDELMGQLHKSFPWYGWHRNVGYPTSSHYEGLRLYGISPHHRRSFNLKTDQILDSASAIKQE